MLHVLHNFWVVLRTYWLSSLLNVFGLAMACASALTIGIQASYEYGFDRSTPNSERLYLLTDKDGGDKFPLPPLEIISQIDHVEASAINDLWLDKDYFVSGDGENYTKEGVQSVSPELFTKMVTPKIVEGSLKAIENPEQFMISRTMAEKLFGATRGVVGKPLYMKDEDGVRQMTVGAIYEDMPSNSLFRNSLYYKFTDEYKNKGRWGNYCAGLYVMLDKPENLPAVEARLKQVKYPNSDEEFNLKLIPLRDLYFANTGLPNVQGGDRTVTHIIILVAILVITIAAINFINFSIAIAPRRMKSLTIHRIFGSSNAGLRFTLISEMVIFCLLSGVFALWLVAVADYTFIASLIKAPLLLSANVGLEAALFGVLIVIGLIAGSLSAGYLMRRRSGNHIRQKMGVVARNLLLGFQYTISVALIVIAIVMNSQTRFLKNMDLGFKQDNILMFEITPDMYKERRAALVDALKAGAQIEEVAFTDQPFASDDNIGGIGRNFKGKTLYFDVTYVSPDFPRLIGLTIEAGRHYNASDQLPKGDVYISWMFNAKTAREYNINPGDTLDRGVVVGISNDYNYKSLTSKIGNIALMCFTEGSEWSAQTWVYCRYNGDRDAATKLIQRTVTTLDKGMPVVVQDFAETINRRYMKDNNQMLIISLFSIISIVISLMGVLSLVLIEVKARTKEVGMRRIHGATIMNILGLFNRKFLAVAIISSAVAVPVAYYFAKEWLNSFEYRIVLGWEIFALGVLFVLALTVLIVTLCCWQAANTDPVKSTKIE